jgi:hypothetical protein
MYRSMEVNDYIQKRIDEQCDYYDRAAGRAKKNHFRMRTIAVGGAAIVPIVTSLPFDTLTQYRTAPATIVSLIVTVVIALESIYKYGEQWKNFRSTYEFLKSEKFHFLAGEGQFRKMNPDEAYILLVERCESRIVSENSATLNVIFPNAEHGDRVSGPRGTAL